MQPGLPCGRVSTVESCYDNATYASFHFFLFISCLVTDHLTSHVTAGQVILTMTHRLKAFTLDAGLLLHMSLGDSLRLRKSL
jgi:hypothetical protein